MKKNYAFLFLLFCGFPTFSQSLLKDITTSNASSQPRNMVNANGTLFFQTKGFTDNNTQIWKTDGTPAGTALVKDPASSAGPYINGNVAIGLGNNFLFAAYSYYPANTGTELFISDGSSTSLLKDINPGSNSSYPSDFIVLGSRVIFQADNGVTGPELWVTDGTAANTMLLKDIYAGPNGSYPYNYLVNGGELYFTASDGVNGNELWVTDGTPAGTVLLKDIYSGISTSFASHLTAVGSKVFFTANDGINGTELWVTDGVTTQLVKDINSGSSSSLPFYLTALNNTLLFEAYNGTDEELWISDGTAANTNKLKDINPGNGDSSPEDLIKVGNVVFFDATDGVNGVELWKTDGTSAGTVMVKNINPATGTFNFTFPYNSWERRFFNVNGVLYFLGNSGAEGFELWKSDGTAAGTSLVKDFVSGSVSTTYNLFTIMGSNLYFAANDDTGGTYFWKTDGTSAGTVQISSLNPSLSIENVYPLSVASNKLYFAAYNAATGYELYVSDGSTITFLKDLDTSMIGDYKDFTYKAAIGQNVLFSYNDNKHGLEIWKTDGTNGQTQKLSDFLAYPFYASNDYWSNSSSFVDMVSYNGYVYISISGVNGGGIWRTDGNTMSLLQTYSDPTNFAIMNGNLYWGAGGYIYSTNGTSILTVSSSFSLAISNLIAINGTLYFNSGTSATGGELWKSDGLVAGTTAIVKDITSGSSSTTFGSEFAKMGNKLFFTVYNSNGTELWVSDGSDAGTFMVKDIYLGSSGSFPNSFTNFNDNLLIFTANDGTHGSELWKTDGTTANTTMIADIYSGSNSSSPSNSTATYNGLNQSNSGPNKSFTVLNNRVYFYAYNSSNSTNGLYVTDGVSATLVKGNMAISNITTVNNLLYFQGNDYPTTLWYELYKSDGTATGTTLVKDIYTGNYNGSFPNSFFFNNNLLYFMAYENMYGLEPYVMKICPDSINIATTLNGLNVYQENKAIVGDNPNELTSGSRTTYNAGKYVLLKPGFKTDNGAIFLAKIQGCVYDPTNPPTAGNSRRSESTKTYDIQTSAYLQEEREKPTIEEFIKYSDDKELLEIYNHFQAEVYVLKTQYAENLQMLANLNRSNDSVKNSNNQIEEISAQKRQTQAIKEKLDQYRWKIAPIKNQNGRKEGYELIMQIGEKEYKGKMTLK